MLNFASPCVYIYIYIYIHVAVSVFYSCARHGHRRNCHFICCWSAGGFASGSVTYLLMMVLTACLQWSARK